MQQLSVNLTIPVPSDSVLISKIELQELKQQHLTGTCWSMADLEKRAAYEIESKLRQGKVKWCNVKTL